jgi:sugar-specific transcriptional regulator TrmB
MNSIELVVVRFAEVTAKEIAENINAKGVDGNKKAIEKSGEIVNKAVKEIESTTGKSVISKDNFKNTDTNETTRHILQAESNHTELPTFDQNLKGLLNTPPPKKNKK